MGESVNLGISILNKLTIYKGETMHLVPFFQAGCHTIISLSVIFLFPYILTVFAGLY